MSNLKKIDFSVAATTEEIRAIPNITDTRRNWLIQMDLLEESQRREMAIRIANEAECGLDISVYESHSEYFLNFDKSEGDINEQFYKGMNDERDGRVYVR